MFSLIRWATKDRQELHRLRRECVRNRAEIDRQEAAIVQHIQELSEVSRELAARGKRLAFLTRDLHAVTFRNLALAKAVREAAKCSKNCKLCREMLTNVLAHNPVVEGEKPAGGDVRKEPEAVDGPIKAPSVV